MQNGRELWIYRIYFPMENLVDRVHDMWTGWHGSGLPWTEAAWTRGHGGARRAGTRARQCSPAAVEEDEPDEVVPEGCSPEHERWQRGGTMEVKNDGGLSSARG
jgi:hypothetical protein